MTAIKRKKKICVECGEEGYIFSRGACKKCANLEYAKTTKANRIAKQNNKNSIKKTTRKRKQTIAKLKGRARYWFQRWIRLTRKNFKCGYGCGAYLNNVKTHDAGHFLKAELYPEATFDPDNVWPVCKGCNIRDPQLEYRKELVRRHGQEWVETLENKYKINRGSYKWDRIELEEIRDKYKILCRELEKSK